jgi:surface protein
LEGTTTIAITNDNVHAAADLFVSDEDTAKNKYGPIEDWDVSGVTEMNNLFRVATAFNADISKWNVSGVTDMQSMFYYATAFNQNISKWDVSSVTDMFTIFQGAFAFNQDISAWDVSGVTNMNSMFKLASAFNQNLCAWGSKLDSTTDVQFMFDHTGCPNKNDPILTDTPPGPFCSSSCPIGMYLGYIA